MGELKPYDLEQAQKEAKERVLRIRDANNWIEQVGNKIENPDLVANNIEVFSDEQLQSEDIEFIIATKAQLDTGDGKPVRIIILNKEHWSEFMGLLGRDDSHRQFVGRAEEKPITPADINQFLVLPSSEVFSQDTPYRQMYLASPKVQEIINQPEGAETLYRGIYLRNVLSHEMAHLYQFSSAEIQDILQSDDTGYHEKFNKFLETREFLSCLFGLFNLKKNDQSVYEAYIDACQQLVKDGTGDAYVIEQAKRSLDSVNLLDSFSEQDIDEMFKKFHKICQSDDEEIKVQLQTIVEGEINVGKLNELIKFLGLEKTNDHEFTQPAEVEQEFVFPLKERNRGVKTEAFGNFSEDKSVVLERLKIRLKDKEFIVAGIGSEKFSNDNEEDKEIEYLLQYAADVHIPILFLTPVGTKNDDYFREFHYQGAEHVLAMARQMGIEIEFAGNLFSASDRKSPQVEKIFKDRLSKRFGKKQWIILTDGSPIVGGSKLLMKLIENNNTLVIDRKSKIDEVGDALEQSLGIENRQPRVILTAQDYLTNPNPPIDTVTVIYNLNAKDLFLKVLDKLRQVCGNRNDVSILIQSPNENPKLTNFRDLSKEIQNTSEDDLLGKHLTIAFYASADSL